MYTISTSTPMYRCDDRRVVMPAGFARDLLTHLEYESDLTVICPRAPDRRFVEGGIEVDLDAHEGMSIRLLPWNGSWRSWLFQRARVRHVLIEEARRASVWHTGCSRNLVWDLPAMSYSIGRKHAAGIRVFCLDSDPAAMLEASGGLGRLKARMVRAAMRRRVADADATIFVGEGPFERYGAGARRSIVTSAVWLQDGDVASESVVERKHALASYEEGVRLCLPSRLTAWKGVDDVLHALESIPEMPVPWSLDIIGNGPEKGRLTALAGRNRHADRIRFREPVEYGEAFFELLRGYHVVLVPTRGLEEARIVYDAAASGCVLIHSKTSTLMRALEGLRPRWTHEPGNVPSLSQALASAFSERTTWKAAGLAGVRFMQGRTIEEMHRIRAEALGRGPGGLTRPRE